MQAVQPTAMLRLERRFRAPREKVFQAFTDAAMLRRWFGPPGYEVFDAQIDLRAGGRYRFSAKKLPDGDPFYLSGAYLEVDRPARLVFTWNWEGSESDPGETRVTIELRAELQTDEDQTVVS